MSILAWLRPYSRIPSHKLAASHQYQVTYITTNQTIKIIIVIGNTMVRRAVETHRISNQITTK